MVNILRGRRTRRSSAPITEFQTRVPASEDPSAPVPLSTPTSCTPTAGTLPEAGVGQVACPCRRGFRPCAGRLRLGCSSKTPQCLADRRACIDILGEAATIAAETRRGRIDHRQTNVVEEQMARTVEGRTPAFTIPARQHLRVADGARYVAHSGDIAARLLATRRTQRLTLARSIPAQTETGSILERVVMVRRPPLDSVPRGPVNDNEALGWPPGARGPRVRNPGSESAGATALSDSGSRAA